MYGCRGKKIQIYICFLFLTAYHQPVNPPTSQRKSGVKTPASYIPHQTVNSTSFPFANKQINARPKSHIGLPSLDSNTQVPGSSQVGHERQTHSPGVPVTQSPVSQHKLSQQQVTSSVSTPVSYVRMDVQNLSHDMHRLSLDPLALEQARLGKPTKMITQTNASSVTKSASSGSLAQQGASSTRPTVSVGSQHGGEFSNESYQSQAAGHQLLYQDETQTGGHSLQEGT